MVQKIQIVSDKLKISKGEEISRSWKLLTSIVICYCTFTLGIGVGLLGPALVELSRQLDTTISVLSTVFTIQTFTFLFAALACGSLFNYVNRQIVTILLLFIMGIGTILLPIVPSTVAFFCVAAIVGFGWAGYDTAQIVWIIELWDNKAAPYIQTQHFSYAVGTFVSPLVARLFLPNEKIDSLDNRTNFTTKDAHTHKTDNGDLLYVPFLMGGLVTILGGIFIGLLYCIKKYEKPVSPVPETTECERDGKSKTWNKHKMLLVVLSAIFLGGLQGMELCNFQFIPTFAQFIDLKLSQPDAALVLSAVAGAYTIGRGLGILFVLKVLPEYLLFSNIILIAIGNTLFYVLANTSASALWAGAIFLGFGFSTVLPSFYGFIEKYLKVSNVVGAIMIVAGGIVSSLYPIIIGTNIEKNPFVLMYTNYFSISICTISFLFLYVVTHRATTGNTCSTDLVNKPPNPHTDTITCDKTARVETAEENYKVLQPY